MIIDNKEIIVLKLSWLSIVLLMRLLVTNVSASGGLKELLKILKKVIVSKYTDKSLLIPINLIKKNSLQRINNVNNKIRMIFEKLCVKIL